MPQDSFHYDKMIEHALRGVVRDALQRVARGGLPGDHHFYIGFATADPGVAVPAHLLAKFPEQMTIVIQHQFWDLAVDEDAFSVTLSFQSRPERLTIPFAAIKSFADPAVNFALEFAAAEPAAPDAAPPVAIAPAPEAVPKEPKEGSAGAEVVALDSFRKR